MKKLTLGQKVKVIRKELGWDQITLAYKAGVSLGTIWRIEGDKGKPYNQTIKAIAAALKVKPQELV